MLTMKNFLNEKAADKKRWANEEKKNELTRRDSNIK